MLLEIENPKGKDMSEFCDFVIYLMQEHVNTLKWDRNLTDMWEDYFRTHDLGWAHDSTGNQVCPTIKWIVHKWFSSLGWYELDSSYYIIPDEDLKLNSTEISVDMLARLVNYGNLELAPYRVIEDVLDQVAEQLPAIWQMWIASGGKS